MLVRKVGNEKDFKAEKVTTIYADRQCFERLRCKIITEDGKEMILNLRGTSLNDGDIFETDEGTLVKIKRKPEEVIAFSLNDLIEAFKLGFEIGNMHMRVMLKNNEVTISTEMGKDLLLQKLREYKPYTKREVFIPNLEPTVVMINF
ncbi:hypothetical protein [Acidianus sp. HS-5]|uniref:urease accessory protein UreE n=1 Tax=Acidianus sp. HS-5 TaxID=2886040 RepID=UPI001F19D54D|nr:hypothetical protein [Acidianus sp. HS-5]BDC18872.1 urease accessory protein UreE [Acidianus sp. HS-5]